MASSKALVIQSGITKQIPDADTLLTGVGLDVSPTASGALAIGASATSGAMYGGATMTALTIGAGMGATDTIDIGGIGSLTTIKGNLQVDGAETITGISTFNDDAQFNGNVTFGNATSDTVTFVSRVVGNVTFTNLTDHALNVAASTTAGAAGKNLEVEAGYGATGTVTAGGAGGALQMFSGAGGDGPATFSGGAGGDIGIQALAGGNSGAGAAGGAGGSVTILAGDAGTSAAGGANGGDLSINAGLGSGTGTVGTIGVGNTQASAIQIGNSTHNTTVTMPGTGQKTINGNLDVTGGLDVTGAGITGPSVRVSNGTAAYMEWDDGDSAAVSAANEGRIRYSETNQRFEISSNTGAYVPIATGTPATETLAATLVAGNTTGATATTAGNNIVFSGSGVSQDGIRVGGVSGLAFGVSFSNNSTVAGAPLSVIAQTGAATFAGGLGSINGGAGGTASGASAGGTGGGGRVTAGAGGDAAGGAGAAGTGGGAQMLAGDGGAGTATGVAGAGGAITILAGSAGADNGAGGSSGGLALLQAGTGTGGDGGELRLIAGAGGGGSNGGLLLLSSGENGGGSDGDIRLRLGDTNLADYSGSVKGLLTYRPLMTPTLRHATTAGAGVAFTIEAQDATGGDGGTLQLSAGDGSVTGGSVKLDAGAGATNGEVVVGEAGATDRLKLNTNVLFTNAADRNITVDPSPSNTAGRELLLQGGNAGASTSTQRDGGSLAGYAGNGGNAASTIVAGEGGWINLNAGSGGTAGGSGTDAGGVGGTAQLRGGPGGTASVAGDTTGPGGAVVLRGGEAGFNAGSATEGLAGDAVIDGGNAVSAANRGTISIGVNYAKAILLGNATDNTPVTLQGSGGLSMTTDGFLRMDESAAAPTTGANTGAVYLKDAGGLPQLFYRTESNGVEYQITPAATPATETLAQTLAAGFYTGANATTSGNDIVFSGDVGQQDSIRIGGLLADTFQITWSAPATAGAGDIQITGQTAGGASNDGGDIILLPGASTGAGTPGAIDLRVQDNAAAALLVRQGTDSYIAVTTTNAAEQITFGSTTINPAFEFRGSGDIAVGAGNVEFAAVNSHTISVAVSASTTVGYALEVFGGEGGIGSGATPAGAGGAGRLHGGDGGDAGTTGAAGLGGSVVTIAGEGGVGTAGGLAGAGGDAYLRAGAAGVSGGAGGAGGGNVYIEAGTGTNGANGQIFIGTDFAGPASSTDEITFGNTTTNPQYSFLGSGSFSVDGPATLNGAVTLGDTSADEVKSEGTFRLREMSAPTALANYGSVYVKSSDSNLYFKTDGGTEYQLTPTGSGGSSGKTVIVVDTTTNSMLTGQAAYISAAGIVNRTDADVAASSRFAGFYQGTVGEIQVAGVADVTGRITGALTVGAPVYLDTATAGNVTNTAPVSAGQYVADVGLAVTTTTVLIQPKTVIAL